MLANLLAFLQLTRPAFLLGGALLYGLGAALAASAGAAVDWGRYALGQAIVTSIQLMTHYANEYFDREGDRLIGADRTWLSGGSGVLPAGRLAPEVALNAARACAVLAISLIATALAVEPAASAIGLLALLGGWFYSAPPLRLSATGFGEVATALIVAFLAPLSGIVMQHGPVDARLVGIALPLMLIHVAMLIAFEFPDHDADRRTGKRTLAVRLGLPRASRLHNALVLASFAAVWIGVALGWIDPAVAAWTLIGLPLAAWQIGSALRQARRPRHGGRWLTAGGLGLFALTSATFLAGLLIR
jgi:1,4-dihydroxy-2-naphthoate octaprenyltransferase